MPDMLKNRWQKAIWSALSKFDELARAANTPVAVVPMLAPRVNGKARSRDTTPTPIRGVRADVKMELDWTNIVNPAPTKIAK